MKQLKFNTTKPQQFRDMGGEHVAICVGRCLRCKRNVYQQYDVPRPEADRNAALTRPIPKTYDPDPRGLIGPTHASASLVAEEYGAQAKAKDAIFCYDCLWEGGSERYESCLSIARKLWGAV